jgi:hypothetical protein
MRLRVAAPNAAKEAVIASFQAYLTLRDAKVGLTRYLIVLLLFAVCPLCTQGCAHCSFTCIILLDLAFSAWKASG